MYPCEIIYLFPQRYILEKVQFLPVVLCPLPQLMPPYLVVSVAGFIIVNLWCKLLSWWTHYQWTLYLYIIIQILEYQFCTVYLIVHGKCCWDRYSLAKGTLWRNRPLEKLVLCNAMVNYTPAHCREDADAGEPPYKNQGNTFLTQIGEILSGTLMQT